MKTIKTIDLNGQKKSLFRPGKSVNEAKFSRVSDEEAEIRVRSSNPSERVTYSTKSAYRRQAKVEK